MTEPTADSLMPLASGRRGWLLGGVALAAAAAGAGLAWWRLRPGPAEEGAVSALWGQTFERPEGGSLAMAGLRGHKLLVNFWATWCPPCVEEMPLLDRFARENASSGWKVIGLAVDQAAAVRPFLTRVPVSFPIGLIGPGGIQLARSLGNTVGGLPFTVVIDADGRVRERKMGQVTPAELSAWTSALGR